MKGCENKLNLKYENVVRKHYKSEKISMEN